MKTKKLFEKNNICISYSFQKLSFSDIQLERNLKSHFEIKRL